MNFALFSVCSVVVMYSTSNYAVYSHATDLDTTMQKQMKNGSYGKCNEEYMCGNGGKCIDSFCKCRNGTSGDLCSVIDACETEPKPCGSDLCRYNVTEEKEYCHPSQWFHPEEKRRYDKCAEDEDNCKNGGICYKKDGTPLCFCKEGTLGEECGGIQKCLLDFCNSQNEDVTCKFSVEKEQAFCECHDSSKVFHELDKMCKIKCDDYSKCENGGECTGDPESLCECKKGTSGDLCATIDACAEDPGICGSEAKCVYDAVKEDIFCECDDSEWFDKQDKTCKRGCDEEEHACKNGGYCVKSLVPICECRKGTSGNLCSLIDACEPKGELCGSVKCNYDVSKEEAFCDCEDDSKWFDATDKICKDCSCSDNEECVIGNDGRMNCVCKEGFGRNGDSCMRKCNEDYLCHNGGECIGYPESFCRCKAGTSGDVCATVDACEKDPHQCHQGICGYNVAEETAYCYCEDPARWFHPVDKTCHEICEKEYDICENGGFCYLTSGGPNCFCKKGTSGYQCKTIEGCLKGELCGSNDDVSCMLDAEKDQPFCKCADSSKKFHELDKVCRRPCAVDSDCLFEGQCLDVGGVKFCHCSTGTHGDTCQIIDVCDSGDLKCGPHAVCVWDHLKQEAYCICLRGLTFNATTGTCQRKCNREYQCENGGECIEDSDNFCQCKPGTSGDLCSVVDACEQDPPLCGKALCSYNVTQENAYCHCKNPSEWFHPKEKTCFEMCHTEDTIDFCKNGGLCFSWYGYTSCFCKQGTTGFSCQKIEACFDKEYCGTSDEVSCTYDTEEEQPFCKCEHSWKMFHELEKVCKIPCSDDTNCQFGGQCLAVGDAKFCNCTRGTSGDVCQFIDDCDSGALSCGLDAFCTWDLLKNEPYCECFGGLIFNTTTGTCQNPCQDRHCNGRGVCEFDPKDKETRCLCKDGWKGLDCDIHPCQGRNCNGQGVCEWDSDHEKTRCLCRDGWKGPECNIHPCQGGNCSGHGVCEWNPDYRETRCICRDGWTGTECSIHPCKDKDCNRNGICIWDYDQKQTVCVCKNGWIGEQCEMRPQEKIFENFKITIAVAVTCAILFFVLLLVFIRRIRELERKVIEA